MTKASPQQGGWIIVALLFFFMLINFVDKAIIGLAGVPIMKELGLTPKEFGLVNSSFFFLFSISAIVTGFIVNHIQTRWALLVMGLIWALTQFPMLGTVGLTTLIACRVALGAGEGPAYPVALHATYKWFPNELRTLPTAVISQGAAIGVVIAIPLLDYIIEEFSWHWAFGLLGGVGLVWVIAWSVLGKEGGIVTTVTPKTQQLELVPYGRLLLNGTVLSGFAAGFGAYWGLSLLVGWFTPFLINGLGYTQKDASWITTLPSGGEPLHRDLRRLVLATSVGAWRRHAGGTRHFRWWKRRRWRHLPDPDAVHAQRWTENGDDNRRHFGAGGDLCHGARHRE